MKDISEKLTKEDIAQIVSVDDLKIAPYRANGRTLGTLTWIWSVSVNGELYVRAYNGVNSRWYQSAMTQGSGKITGAGLERMVRFRKVSGPVNEEIDEAYRKKYAGSPYLRPMISERARSATVQIVSQ